MPKELVYNILGRYDGPPMKLRAVLCVFCLLGVLPAARAQIGVGLTIPRRDYILYEPIMAEISLLNSSGRNIVFNEDEKWIDIEVVREKVELIPKTDRPIIDKNIYLDSASSATLKTNVTYTHEIREPGSYELQVKVRYKGRTYASAIQNISVVNGAVQWKQRFVFTHPKSRKEQVRDYELIAQKADKGNRLVARIRDPETRRVMCCTPVGDLIGFGDPEAKIDSGGMLHILNQIAPRQYAYSRLSPDGIRGKVRYFLSLGGSVPALIDSGDEGVMVLGGREVSEDGKLLALSRKDGGRDMLSPMPARPVSNEELKEDRKKRDSDD